jgi:hypothetical protein
MLGGDPFLIVRKQRSDSTMSLIEFGITDASSPAAMPLLSPDNRTSIVNNIFHNTTHCCTI